MQSAWTLWKMVYYMENKRKLYKSVVGYATTNDPTTKECYNE